MTHERFIKYYSPEMSEYCPVVIRPDGNIFDSTLGHIQTLVSLSPDPDILKNIPKDVSPLLYMADMLRCVIVDYENQIYVDELTPLQEEALTALVRAGLIKDHKIRMPHESIKL
jgi:hypothetical protein